MSDLAIEFPETAVGDSAVTLISLHNTSISELSVVPIAYASGPFRGTIPTAVLAFGDSLVV